MRSALAISIVLVCGLGAGHHAHGDQARGFDHVSHDGKINVTGKSPPPCGDCHALDKKGRVKGAPGHAACFGACHGAAPAKPKGKKAYVIAEAQQSMCGACHAPAALTALTSGGARTVAAAYPPYTIERDFELALSHASHDAAAPCQTCHDAQARPAGGKGHDRCAACHLAPAAGATRAPALSQCSACHVAAYGPARGPELSVGPLAVGAAFSHGRHSKAAGSSDCRSCHGAVATAVGRDLPGPTTADCRACHDGKAAFSTTEKCTTCHTAEPTTSYQLVTPATAYSHERHRARLPDARCSGCHSLDRRGEATAPRHTACADAGCHLADFVSTTPTTCGACHVAIEPWRKLVPEALPRPETEFGAAMPHRRHRDLGRTCNDCHSLDTGLRERRPPRGHVSCTGSGCHVAAGGPTPQLADCGDCHRADLVSARSQERLAAQWTVRARFAHDAHLRDSDGAEVACERCHDGVWEVDNLPREPAKRSCASCHDGKTAFKMTGHGCARCHGTD